MSWSTWLVFLVHFLTCIFDTSCETVCPPIISRADWNATAPTSEKALAIIPPPFVVVHHSATQSCFTKESCERLVKSIQYYHMVTEGWEDIGYNFLISGDGSIYEGRGWGIHGAHVIKYNARSIGICLLGNFQVETPPKIQVDALNNLISCAKITKKITEDFHLIGHRQGSATLCPGDYLFELVEESPNFDPKPQ